jgi:molybdate transport system permease protein
MSWSWQPLFLTFRLAFVTTLILLLIGIPLAYWLAYTRFRWKYWIETLVSMPLVLPPTVLGFYLLIAFSPQNLFGHLLDRYLGIRLVFTFEGLVIGSVLFSLPFMINPLVAGFQNLPISLREASFTLGKSAWTTMRRVLLPCIKPSLLSGIVLSFAHTIGEFGVVLMIGGNIPDETRVSSIAIYNEVEALRFQNANAYALVLFATTFLILLFVYSRNTRFKLGG